MHVKPFKQWHGGTIVAGICHKSSMQRAVSQPKSDLKTFKEQAMMLSTTLNGEILHQGIIGNANKFTELVVAASASLDAYCRSKKQ